MHRAGPATQPGESLTFGHTVYEVLPRSTWFCGHVPVGRIVAGPNVGHQVILVNAQYDVPSHA